LSLLQTHPFGESRQTGASLSVTAKFRVDDFLTAMQTLISGCLHHPLRQLSSHPRWHIPELMAQVGSPAATGAVPLPRGQEHSLPNPEAAQRLGQNCCTGTHNSGPQGAHLPSWSMRRFPIRAASLRLLSSLLFWQH
jgi:hypothetical protein